MPGCHPGKAAGIAATAGGPGRARGGALAAGDNADPAPCRWRGAGMVSAESADSSGADRWWPSVGYREPEKAAVARLGYRIVDSTRASSARAAQAKREAAREKAGPRVNLRAKAAPVTRAPGAQLAARPLLGTRACTHDARGSRACHETEAAPRRGLLPASTASQAARLAAQHTRYPGPHRPGTSLANAGSTVQAGAGGTAGGMRNAVRVPAGGSMRCKGVSRQYTKAAGPPSGENLIGCVS